MLKHIVYSLGSCLVLNGRHIAKLKRDGGMPKVIDKGIVISIY
jgi:hypothetical protein